jgi:hypothetical protein
MDQPKGRVSVYFPAEASHLDVDHVVDGCGTPRFFPYVSGEHFPGDVMALVSQEILEQLELATGQVEDPLAPNDAASDEVQLEIRGLQSKHLRWPTAPQQRPNPREQFGKREWLDQIIVRPEIKAEHPIVDPVACRQYQDRSVDVSLPQRLQDLETAASGQHQVKDDQIEHFGIRSVESVLSRCGDDDPVMLSLER